MKPSEIGKNYDRITHLWLSPDFNMSNGIEPHQQALKFVQNRGYALDIGCGLTGRFITQLLKEGFTPEGVDISEEMLKNAKQRLPETTFYKADICDWTIPKQYDFISAWDSIWHVPLEEQEKVIRKIVEALNPGGVFIFSFGGTDKACEKRDSNMGPEMYYSTLGINGFLNVLLDSGVACRHLELDDGKAGMHAYLIVEKL